MEKYTYARSMTKENILNLCKKNQLYLTPHLNDVLYLHYQGEYFLILLLLCNLIFKYILRMFQIETKYYQVDSLNDFLWSGYQKIENLDEYKRLKCLWLECNAITEITGLEHQTELRCLYLQNNFIRVSTSALPYHEFC